MRNLESQADAEELFSDEYKAFLENYEPLKKAKGGWDLLYLGPMCRSACIHHGKLREHKRCVRVTRGIASSNSRFLSALQTSKVSLNMCKLL